MTLRFAYTRPDGGVSIVVVVDKANLDRLPVIGEFGPLSQEHYRQFVLERSIPPDASDVSELPDNWQPPDDRTFRDAWVYASGIVTIDMSKAREIHRNRLRAARKTVMEQLDGNYMLADERGDNAAKIKITKRKQKLRDIVNDPD